MQQQQQHNNSIPHSSKNAEWREIRDINEALDVSLYNPARLRTQSIRFGENEQEREQLAKIVEWKARTIIASLHIFSFHLYRFVPIVRSVRSLVGLLVAPIIEPQTRTSLCISALNIWHAFAPWKHFDADFYFVRHTPYTQTDPATAKIHMERVHVCVCVHMVHVIRSPGDCLQQTLMPANSVCLQHSVETFTPHAWLLRLFAQFCNPCNLPNWMRFNKRFDDKFAPIFPLVFFPVLSISRFSSFPNWYMGGISQSM